MTKNIIVLLFVCLSGIAIQAQNPAKPLVDQMISAMKNVRTLEGTMKRSERVDGELAPGQMNFKLQVNPHALYIYNVAPDEGAEVMYCKTALDGKAFIHPNKFPWVNVTLDPRSKTLTGGQHHSMESVGFDKMYRIVTAALKKYGDKFDQYVHYKGTQQWYGATVDVVEIKYTDFAYENYTVLPGEDLWKIGAKLNLPEYRIKELNGLKDYTSLRAGQVLKVPNVYAPHCVFYLDRKNHLPIVQIIMDEKGLYEKYEYSNLKVNHTFPAGTFDLQNPAYKFF